MRAQVGNLLLGKCAPEASGSGNVAAEAEARLKRLLGARPCPVFRSEASYVGATSPRGNKHLGVK